MKADFLTKEELNSFPRRLVNSGENICLPNDSAELAFIIEDGQAKIKNQILYTGQIIGFIDIVTKSNYLNKIVAKKNCRLICFNREQLKKMICNKSNFLWLLLTALSYSILEKKRHL